MDTPSNTTLSCAIILTLPAFPVPLVLADICVPLVTVREPVLILISPALPLPTVSTVILPSPVISIVSGALILILPPLPIDVVEAEIKPSLVKVILRLGSNSPNCSPTPL